MQEKLENYLELAQFSFVHFLFNVIYVNEYKTYIRLYMLSKIWIRIRKGCVQAHFVLCLIIEMYICVLTKEWSLLNRSMLWFRVGN